MFLCFLNHFLVCLLNSQDKQFIHFKEIHRCLLSLKKQFLFNTANPFSDVATTSDKLKEKNYPNILSENGSWRQVAPFFHIKFCLGFTTIFISIRRAQSHFMSSSLSFILCLTLCSAFMSVFPTTDPHQRPWCIMPIVYFSATREYYESGVSPIIFMYYCSFVWIRLHSKRIFSWHFVRIFHENRCWWISEMFYINCAEQNQNCI